MQSAQSPIAQLNVESLVNGMQDCNRSSGVNICIELIIHLVKLRHTSTGQLSSGVFMNNITAGFTGQYRDEDYLTLEAENQKLRARIADLECLVRRDCLTPLYNRRHFIDVLDRWVWRTHRYGGDSAILYADVDQLKLVNDQYGHGAGDKMLIAIAQTLKNSVRRSDIAARIGGDEFGLLLENIKAEELPAKAQKIANAVAKLAVDYNGSALKCSVSIGFTIIQSGMSAADLVKRADASMYAIKLQKSRAPQ
jgi:diguanylate cyclase (GGDEF)-like protein